MKKLCPDVFLLLLLLLSLSTLSVFSLSSQDFAAMQALNASIVNPGTLNWTDPNPCEWSYVKCFDNRVTHIQIHDKSLQGSLPPQLRNLSSLKVLDVGINLLTNPIPSLAGLSSLEVIDVSINLFTSIPNDFFSGLSSLNSVCLDANPFSSWEIPESLKDATELQTFSANGANISGAIPDFLVTDYFPKLLYLYLSVNNLEGPIPPSFGKSSIQTLWLNNQVRHSRLNGSLEVFQNMTSLTSLWLHQNSFTGYLPDVSRLNSLEELTVGANELRGIVPSSLVNLPNLSFVSLGSNFLQGPAPNFNMSKVKVDNTSGSNSYCLDEPGAACDHRVNILLSVVKSLGYPLVFARSWKGNDPCKDDWKGIKCNGGGQITVVNFTKLGLMGSIASDYSLLTSLERLILSNNALNGTIPNELTSLPHLRMLDVSNNNLSGEVPKFRKNVIIKIDGNPDIVRDNSTGKIQVKDKPSNTGILLVSVFTGAAFGLIIAGLGFCLYKRKRKQSHGIHRPKIGSMRSQDAMKSNIHTLGVGSSVFSIEDLREVTKNFNKQNILGRGGFGIVYKGELEDGTEIAVKRMEVEIVSERRLRQFKSEIAVLTKVRHRHLVALLGYCLEGKERLLVYEFMSQGTLSRRLFNWKNEEGLKPLDWSRRMIIALDVARGVEYLHGLASESFIHRDLKPSNILLGDDLRAKVSDFGLVRLATENGKHSTETRIAGTFGYLAPEYVVTGRVTAKVDVFSFGVILIQLITGRKVIETTDQSDPEDILYVVTWFRTIDINQEDTFRRAVDETMEEQLDERTLAGVRKVAELADHCCANDPCNRPDMARVVNVLSSVVVCENHASCS